MFLNITVKIGPDLDLFDVHIIISGVGLGIDVASGHLVELILLLIALMICEFQLIAKIAEIRYGAPTLITLQHPHGTRHILERLLFFDQVPFHYEHFV